MDTVGTSSRRLVVSSSGATMSNRRSNMADIATGGHDNPREQIAMVRFMGWRVQKESKQLVTRNLSCWWCKESASSPK